MAISACTVAHVALTIGCLFIGQKARHSVSPSRWRSKSMIFIPVWKVPKQSRSDAWHSLAKSVTRWPAKSMINAQAPANRYKSVTSNVSKPVIIMGYLTISLVNCRLNGFDGFVINEQSAVFPLRFWAIDSNPHSSASLIRANSCRYSLVAVWRYLVWFVQ